MSRGAAPISREERAEQLLQVATRLFAEGGYHATSVADVIREAGIARGTFYNYWKSKRDLFGAVLEQQIEALWDAVDPIRLDGPVEPQVRANLIALLDAVRPGRPLPRILFAEAVGLDEEATEQLASFYRRSLARLVRSLELGQQLGVVRQGNPRVMAASLIGMIREWALQNLLGNELGDREDCAAEFYRLLSGGMLRLDARHFGPPA